MNSIRTLGKGTMYIQKQVRFPKSKKKRIRKKWTKNKQNWKNLKSFSVDSVTFTIDLGK